MEIDLPESWKITRGEIPLIMGLAPSGAIAIRFSEPRLPVPAALPTLNIDPSEAADPVSYSKEQVNAIVEHARQQVSQNPKKYISAEVRTLDNDVRALDQQQIEPATAGGEDGQGHTLSGSAESIKWTISVFVPYKQRFRLYQLSFMDLAREQFEKDQDFLRQIMGTLRYDRVLGKETGMEPGAEKRRSRAAVIGARDTPWSSLRSVVNTPSSG